MPPPQQIDLSGFDYFFVQWWTGVLFGTNEGEARARRRAPRMPQTLFENMEMGFPMRGFPIDLRGLR